jgi:hypothetical protein
MTNLLLKPILNTRGVLEQALSYLQKKNDEWKCVHHWLVIGVGSTNEKKNGKSPYLLLPLVALNKESKGHQSKKLFFEPK